jgi:hypothetical protein
LAFKFNLRRSIKDAWAAARKVKAFLDTLPAGLTTPERPIRNAASFAIHLVVNGERGAKFELEPGDKVGWCRLTL